MRKKGSAILTIISAIVVLLVLALGYVSSKSQKTVISKHLSDEKKVEALAESIADMVMTYIKKVPNDYINHQDVFYYFLRSPLKIKDKDELDVSSITPIEDFSVLVPYEEILRDTIKQYGWEDNEVVEKVKCEIIKAESFTPYKENYKVTTIDTEHFPARGKSAKFLDETTFPVSPNDDGDDYKKNKWKLKLKFPNGLPLEERKTFTVSYGIGFQESLKRKWETFKSWLGSGKTQEEIEKEIEDSRENSEITLIVGRNSDYTPCFDSIKVETQNMKADFFCIFLVIFQDCPN